MSSKTVDPEELRRRRRERRAKGNSAAGSEAPPAAAEGDASGTLEPTVEPPVFAQGRPQPMLRLDELPDPIDAPDAHGPLSEDEEERWELCRTSFRQFQRAWWVAAKALDIALRGRLWRRDYETARAFIQDVANMSTSNAYRQIAGAEVAALLVGPQRIELESNDQSRMRDSGPAGDERPLVISQRAAEALAPLREDYGVEAAASAYRTVVAVTGQDKVSGKTITGIVQQIPRKTDEELDADQLAERIRTVAEEQAEKEAAAKEAAADPIKEFREYVDAAREFARRTKGMASAYKKAAKVDPRRADRLATQLHDHMARATRNFPDV